MTRHKWLTAKKYLLAMAAAGVPLATSVTCNPSHGTLDIFRNDDHHDFGFFDIFIDDCFFDDCHGDEIIFFG